MQSATACLTALLVLVAPVTPSMALLCALSTWSASFSAAAAPTFSVSPEESTTTLVMLVSSKVTVTVTSLP